MSAAPGGMGELASVYKICRLFKANPGLCYSTITIRESGRVEVAAEGTHGTLMRWSRALPQHVHHTALVPTQYGLDEADVIEEAGIIVTIRRPLAGPGAIS